MTLLAIKLSQVGCPTPPPASAPTPSANLTNKLRRAAPKSATVNGQHLRSFSPRSYPCVGPIPYTLLHPCSIPFPFADPAALACLC